MNLRSRGLVLLGKVAQRRGRRTEASGQFAKAWHVSGKSDAHLAFRFGQAALAVEDLESAIEGLGAACALEPGNAEWRYRYGFALERAKRWEVAEQAYAAAQVRSPEDGRLAFRRGRCLESLGVVEEAVAQFHASIRLDHRAADAVQSIFRLERQSPVWRRLDVLREGSELRADDRSWALDRAQLATHMRSFDEAAEAYERAAELGRLDEKSAVSRAIVTGESGRWDLADAMLTDLAERSKGRVSEIGPGAYLLERGRWTDAIRLLRAEVDSEVPGRNIAQVEFDIAHAYDRQYLWQDARDWMRRSLVSDPKVAYRHYRLGGTLERLGEIEAACGAYAFALELDPTKSYWAYRLASCERSLGRENDAAENYLRSLGAEPLSPEIQLTTSESTMPAYRRLYADGLVESAQAAVDREPTNARAWKTLREISRAVGLDGDPAAVTSHVLRVESLSKVERADAARELFAGGAADLALDLLAGSREFRFPDGLDLKRYTDSNEKRRRALYAEYIVNESLDQRVVLLESNHGASIGCHPLALFREMSRDPRFEGFTYIWAHTPQASIPKEISTRRDVLLVTLHSDRYLFHLATAGLLVNNVSFAPYFVRREGQRYLNTWHGTPMKTLGRSMKQGLLEYENLARNFVQTTHLMAPNELTRWALVDEHRIDAYYDGRAIVTGSPRLDRLVQEGPQLRSSVRERLGIAKQTRVILYAPTWRGSVSEHEFDVEGLLEDLKAMTGIPDTHLLFRAHRLTESLVRAVDLPVTVVPADIDTNDLLAAVDVLVTDYSSISFDFLPTGRRLILYTPDLDQYRKERGLYIEPADLPATVCESRDELSLALAEAADPVSPEVYAQALLDYAPLEDGKASARCLDAVLDDAVVTADSRPLLVFHASLIPNGIASALLSLLSRLDAREFRMVLIVEGNVMRADEGRAGMLDRVPEHVNLAFRIGATLATPEEQWALGRVREFDAANSPAMDALIARAWSREARRVLGSVTPAAAIEYDGYAKLWAALVANLGGSATRRLIWQHNQLADEYQRKYPELREVFAWYDKFDKVVSVSEALRTENFSQLEDLGFYSDAESVSVPNTLDVSRILRSAALEIPDSLEAWLSDSDFNVVSVGRLSPEKNFEALVEAWNFVQEKHPRAKLTIVGSGLLRATLQSKIDRLGLSDRVRLAGQLPNPYPVMAAASLFVLPSVHEGQPVVVFEAMILGRPVAAAYTPGTAEALQVGYGRLIRSDVAGLSQDLEGLVAEPELAAGVFDPVEFANRAHTDFVRLVTSPIERSR